MQKGLTLKYDTLDNWNDFLKTNSQTPFCNIVGKNGKGKVNPIMLAALSPFLNMLLASLPPCIDGCIILPDFEFQDISTFLESLSLANEKFIVSQSLVRTLGLNLDLFNKVTVRNIEKECDNKWMDICNDEHKNSLNYFPNATLIKEEFSDQSYSDDKKILEDLLLTFIEEKPRDNSQTNSYDFTKSTHSEEEENTDRIDKDDQYMTLNENSDQSPKYVTLSSTNVSLTGVARFHVGDKVPLKCSTCPKTFPTVKKLHRHENTHISEKPFPCDQCQKSYAQQGELNRHKKMGHVGFKFFMCNKCPKTFRREEPYEYHRKTCTSEAAQNIKQIYTCDICMKSYISNRYLKKHKLIHTAVKLYGCTYCGKRFVQKIRKDAHEKTHVENLASKKTVNLMSVIPITT